MQRPFGIPDEKKEFILLAVFEFKAAGVQRMLHSFAGEVLDNLVAHVPGMHEKVAVLLLPA